MAIFESRISDKQLAALSRRMCTALLAGLDVVGVVEREMTSHAPRDVRQQLSTVYDGVRNGVTFADAIRSTGNYFPPLFRELVAVGDETGHLPETLRRVAENVETRITMKRTLLAASFWPLIQLAGALFVVSLIILVQGLLTAADGSEIDLLGIGLSGFSGFVIYWLLVAAAGTVFFFVLRAIMRGMLWTRPLQKLLLRVPVVGTFLEAVAMGNLAWAMSLTFNTGLDVRKAIPLSLNATNNALYKEPIDDIVDTAAHGRSLYDSFSYSSVFPGEFLDVLRVGEESGQLPEAMANLSERCRETAETLLKRLAIIGGFFIWMAIIGLILLVIIRLAITVLVPYYQTVNELSQPGAF